LYYKETLEFISLISITFYRFALLYDTSLQCLS